MTETTTQDPRRQRIHDLLLQSGSDETAATAAANALQTDYLDEFVKTAEQMVAERTELRERFRANPVLTRAFSPAPGWRTANDRYDVTRGALRIAENVAAKHSLTVEAIAQQLVDDEMTVAHEIELYGDPRRDGNFATGSFYAVRCRLGDAVDALKFEERERIHREREAKREAEWEKQGRERCTRCGGAGGAKHWPGFTCFDCGGLGSVEKH